MNSIIFKYGIILLLFLQIFTSCNKQESVDLPFPREKVVAILADVHVSEAALQPLFGEIKDSVSKVYYEQIYEIHDIEPEQLKELMITLKEHPKEMEAIYEEVIDEISRQKANIKSNDTKPDSIKTEEEEISRDSSIENE